MLIRATFLCVLVCVLFHEGEREREREGEGCINLCELCYVLAYLQVGSD